MQAEKAPTAAIMQTVIITAVTRELQAATATRASPTVIQTAIVIQAMAAPAVQV